MLFWISVQRALTLYYERSGFIFKLGWKLLIMHNTYTTYNSKETFAAYVKSIDSGIKHMTLASCPFRKHLNVGTYDIQYICAIKWRYLDNPYGHITDARPSEGISNKSLSTSLNIFTRIALGFTHVIREYKIINPGINLSWYQISPKLVQSLRRDSKQTF